jgi:putative ABC transport system ATP-binding protein
MDRPTSGTIRLNDRDLSTMSDDELTRVRREQVGFVFQFFNLLPTLTVGDNIALPCLLAGMKDQEAARLAKALAERVGIAHRLSHYPQQISGGEMQRAAIARALIHQPALLVADEPTGNLDSENGVNVLALVAELNLELRVTVLLATHAADIAAAASRIVRMKDGTSSRIRFHLRDLRSGGQVGSAGCSGSSSSGRSSTTRSARSPRSSACRSALPSSLRFS